MAINASTNNTKHLIDGTLPAGLRFAPPKLEWHPGDNPTKSLYIEQQDIQGYWIIKELPKNIISIEPSIFNSPCELKITATWNLSEDDIIEHIKFEHIEYDEVDTEYKYYIPVHKDILDIRVSPTRDVFPGKTTSKNISLISAGAWYAVADKGSFSTPFTFEPKSGLAGYQNINVTVYDNDANQNIGYIDFSTIDTSTSYGKTCRYTLVQEESKPYIRIKPTGAYGQIINYNEKFGVLEIESNTTWYSSIDSWAGLIPESGYGNATIDIGNSGTMFNMNPDDRTATFTITDRLGITLSCQMTQLGIPAALTLNPAILQPLNSANQTFTINVTSNSLWEAVPLSGDFYTILGEKRVKGDGAFKINVYSNKGAMRNGSVIVQTLNNNPSNNITRVLHFTQYAVPELSFIPNPLYYDNFVADRNVVKFNSTDPKATWRLQPYSPEILSVTPTIITGSDGEISIRAIPNDSSVNKSDLITYQLTGYPESTPSYSLELIRKVSPTVIRLSVKDISTVTNKGYTEYFDVYSNTAWHATRWPTWTNIRPDYGKGDLKHIALDIFENKTSEVRKGVVIFKTDDRTDEAYLYINQAVKPIPALNIDGLTSYDIMDNGDGGIYNMTLYSTSSWHITTYPATFVHINASSGKQGYTNLIINIDENTSDMLDDDQLRKTFIVFENEESLNANINITQLVKFSDLSVLKSLRDANPDSQLPIIWSDSLNPFTEWKGIIWDKMFKNVKELYINNLSILNGNDLNNLLELEIIECYNNHLSELHLNNLINLKKLDCHGNHLEDINIDSNILLEYLNVSDNEIQPKLNDLDVLKRLRDSNMESLLYDLWNDDEDPYIMWKGITWNKDHTHVIELILNDLEIYDSTYINNLRHLINLNVNNNKLVSLKINNLISLNYLECNNNKISELDLSHINHLIKLDCHNNLLSSLNLDNNLLITYLDISNNNFIEEITDLEKLILFRDSNINSLLYNLWNEDLNPYTEWVGITWDDSKKYVLKLVLNDLELYDSSHINDLLFLQHLELNNNKLI